MASILGKANFLPVANTGISRAKKLADIYIKSHSDNSGVVNDPQVYQYAIDNYLSPFADDLSVQQKVTGYQNNIKKIGEKNYDQNVTLASFKREVQNAVYVTDPRLVSDPGTLAQYTSDQLDKAVFSLNSAIDVLSSQNKSVDQLLTYRTDLNKMASAQRDLVSNISQGTSNPNLDGYGYYVKTNPANGALIGTALLPSFAAPDDLTQNTKRVDSTLSLGNSKIPVYLPATKNADGDYQAQLYGDTWKGSGDTPLSKDSGNNFTDGNFNISDQTKFPVKSFDLQPGQFGRTLSGIDTSGKGTYTYYYRGENNQVYSVNQDAIDQFKADPIMSTKLNGYVPTVGAEDVQRFGSIAPLDSGSIKTDKVAILQQQTKDAAAASQDATAKFNTLNTGVVGQLGKVGEAITGAARVVGSFFSGANRTNKPSPPQAAPQSTDGSYSAPDVVQTGQSFFRNKQ